MYMFFFPIYHFLMKTRTTQEHRKKLVKRLLQKHCRFGAVYVILQDEQN